MKFKNKMLNLVFDNSSDQLEYFSPFWESGNCLKPIFMGYNKQNYWKIVQSNGGFQLRPKLTLFQTMIPIGQKSNGMIREIPFGKIKLRKIKSAKKMIQSIKILFSSGKCGDVQFGGRKVKFLMQFIPNDVNDHDPVHTIRKVLAKMINTIYSNYPSKLVTDIYTYVYLLYYLLK